MNLTAPHGCTIPIPLSQVACLHQQPNAARELIKWGASVTAANKRGETAMSCALLGGGSAEVIEELVAAGAPEPSSRDAKRFDLPEWRALAPSCDGCGIRPRKGQAPLLACSKCRTRRYCSVECQRQAWKAGHKAECASLAAVVLSPEEVDAAKQA